MKIFAFCFRTKKQVVVEERDDKIKFFLFMKWTIVIKTAVDENFKTKTQHNIGAAKTDEKVAARDFVKILKFSFLFSE